MKKNYENQKCSSKTNQRFFSTHICSKYANETIFLSEIFREKLRIPFGKLYNGIGISVISKIRKDVSNAVKVISVGDATLFQLLESNIIPDLMIVDELIQRKPISETISIAIKKATKFKKIVNNPPGSITLNLIEEIEDALSKTVPIQILVKGEEDIAALPVMLMAPISSIVLYGQPNEGLVLVKITESKKQEIRKLFNQIIDNSQQEILNLDKKNNKNILNIIGKINGY
ncbi:MAG: DUF359 domain-containing protein [Methanosarcinales archaeon]|nr:DUF359 domain-containing protein [Methanosarcinales archaeon]